MRVNLISGFVRARFKVSRKLKRRSHWWRREDIILKGASFMKSKTCTWTLGH